MDEKKGSAVTKEEADIIVAACNAYADTEQKKQIFSAIQKIKEYYALKQNNYILFSVTDFLVRKRIAQQVEKKANKNELLSYVFGDLQKIVILTEKEDVEAAYRLYKDMIWRMQQNLLDSNI